MGATGAGKSTLAMAINGLVPHHHEGQISGEMLIEGMITANHDVIDIVRRVGLVMQDPETQITGQTALADAAVGPANFGLPRDVVLAKAQAALALVGMGDLADRDTNRMSGGQKQRLVVAGVIAMDSSILVLDEPTSELDPQGTAEVFGIVRSLSKDNETTIVLIEHEPELIADWADRLLVLNHGRLLFDGAPVDFFGNESLLATAGLRPPQVTSAALALSDAGRYSGDLPITLKGGIDSLPRWDATTAKERTAPEVRPECEIVIEARGLCYVYPGGVTALDQIDVSITAGEFVAVLGRNGAGKTTFARHLNGLLRPTSGELLIAGEVTEGRAVSELATTVGYVFQNPDHQIFANSVRDEVGYGLRNLGWEPDRIAERVDSVLDQVGMSEMVEKHPFMLGKGERQRLAVASVLALEPRVLVIDEPTTGQDWLGARAMMSLVRELNLSGHTILMITHDMTLVAEHARRALVFAHGSLIADEAPHDLFGRADLLKLGSLVAPQVTTLAAALGCPSAVTTLDEFRAQWGLGALA
jgi:energy-coupling factor transporter ATP-binding protein EcfA2